MTPARLLLPASLSLLACVVVLPFALREGSEPAVSAGPVQPAAVAVLHEWDRDRAAAWRRGDPDALERLYTRGAGAGQADRELLASYVERGLRVTGMRMQVAEVDVESVSTDRIVMVVTDRVVGAVAVGRRTRTGLPRDRWSRHRVVLVRVAGRWRVAEVEDQVSMVARTDSTSGSENS